jgi:hypothetical protein
LSIVNDQLINEYKVIIYFEQHFDHTNDNITEGQVNGHRLSLGFVEIEDENHIMPFYGLVLKNSIFGVPLAWYQQDINKILFMIQVSEKMYKMYIKVS